MEPHDVVSKYIITDGKYFSPVIVYGSGKYFICPKITTAGKWKTDIVNLYAAKYFVRVKYKE